MELHVIPVKRVLYSMLVNVVLHVPLEPSTNNLPISVNLVMNNAKNVKLIRANTVYNVNLIFIPLLKAEPKFYA
jgi:hypothetical protein